MATDIYSVYSYTFIDKYTKMRHPDILTLPQISLVGAKKFIITPQFEYAPDLISYRYYGTEDFDDIIIIANGFTDPIKDFYIGREIYLPTYAECERVLGL